MFITGFAAGFLSAFILLIISFIVFTHIQNKRLLSHEDIIARVEREDIEDLIARKRAAFKGLEIFGIESNIGLMRKNALELIQDIARAYCPDSRYPIYELTLEEALHLNVHISQRILKNLEDKRYEVFRRLKISTLFQINDFKKKIQNSPAYKRMERYKLLPLLSKGWMLLNIANPKYWMKKILFDGTLEVAMRSLGILVINAVGKETYSVYSRKYRNEKNSH